MKLILAALLLTAQTAQAPTLSYDGKRFRTQFEAGAVHACVAYRSHTQTIQEGDKMVPYTFRRCFGLPSTLTSFYTDWGGVSCTITDVAKGQMDCPAADTWDIYSEVQYDTGNSIETRQSNTITEKH